MTAVFAVADEKRQDLKDAFFTTSDGVRLHYAEAGSVASIELFTSDPVSGLVVPVTHLLQGKKAS
jgi:hypothetical protein